MDSIDASKILIGRIEKLEPENVPGIVGFLLMHEVREDLIRLVHSPDKLIEEKVQEAKLHLSNRNPSITRTRPYSSPIPIATNPCWNHLITDHQKVLNSDYYTSLGYQDSITSNQNGQFLSFEEMAGIHGEFFYSDPVVGGLRGRISRQTTPPSLPNFPIKTCHYFNKGFCKHGRNCRYIHGGGSSHSPHSLPDSLLSRMFLPNLIDGGGAADDPSFSSGSLEKLEAEITELLKSKRGNPVSIASLPMMYQEKYGRSLQAEGYLTESQRHGRAGFSLTKLLARLKSIRLFERPHGQHFVILAEDALKYSLDNHNEKKDPGPIVTGSRQIYLTFPADSTFTEEDVSSHFSCFGQVEDVRIPCQQKRMFGFVTFMCPNTVKTVLSKGNPHFVCGARVLVKPYREKSKLVDRKYMEKSEQHMYQYYQGHYWDLEPEIHSIPRGCEAPRFLRRQHIMEEHERALELETRHLSELKIYQKSVPTPPYINYVMEELDASEEEAKFLSDERFNHWLDVFTNSSTRDDHSRQARGSYLDQERKQPGNQTLRQSICKPVTEEHFYSHVTKAFKGGGFVGFQKLNKKNNKYSGTIQRPISFSSNEVNSRRNRGVWGVFT